MVTVASPSGKKPRVEGNFLVHLTVPGTDHLEDLPSADPDTPKDEYTLTRTRNLVSVEACKVLVSVEAYEVLETQFSSQLAISARVRSYEQAVICLLPLVLSVVASVNFPIQDRHWYEWVPFGLFSETLRRLIDINNPPAYLTVVMAHAKKLYMDILSIAISDLYQDYETVVRDGNMDLALVFMTTDENFTNIVREWAFMALKRNERNASAHLFDTERNVRKLAIQFYRETLKDEYSIDFRNLGYLSLLKIEFREAQDDVKRRKK